LAITSIQFLSTIKVSSEANNLVVLALLKLANTEMNLDGRYHKMEANEHIISVKIPN
jgi:energy-converting hydrogenase Eha subunit H